MRQPAPFHTGQPFKNMPAFEKDGVSNRLLCHWAQKILVVERSHNQSEASVILRPQLLALLAHAGQLQLRALQFRPQLD